MALTRKERTLGCLWAMACGDALGVPSSFLTPEQIQSKYGWIDTFYPPEKGHIFHDGLLAGEYTDDTEQSMALMNAYIRDKKVVPMSVVKEIIAWADRVKDKYASPLAEHRARAEEHRGGRGHHRLRQVGQHQRVVHAHCTAGHHPRSARKHPARAGA